MELALKIYIQLFSISILFIILLNSFFRNGESLIKLKVFRLLLFSSIFSLIFQLISWIINGNSDSNMSTLIMFINILFFLFAPFSTLLWVFYAYLVVSKKETDFRFVLLLFSIPYLIDLGIVFASPFSKLIFYIDNNIFVEGPLFFLHFISSVVYLLGVAIYIFINRKKIEKLEFPTILIFLISPIIGGIIQAFFNSFSTFLSAITLSLIIVFVNIQNRIINIDLLTKAYSRTYLEYVLNKKIIKIKSWEKATTFAGVFLDLDDFKEINDKYSHFEGDFALKKTKELIELCLEKKGFVSRFGGDEFIIILYTNDYTELKTFIGKLEQEFIKYNEIRSKPYKLSFSFGYMIYDKNSNMKVDDFIGTIDKMMFQNKVNKKSITTI